VEDVLHMPFMQLASQNNNLGPIEEDAEEEVPTKKPRKPR